MSGGRRLEAVDAALESARREARDAALPPPLRARILAATRRGAESSTPPARPPRALLVDFALRAAAVAAVFAAALLVAPVSLEAAEFDAKPLVEWNARLADAVTRSLPSLDVDDAADLPAGVEWPVAAASAALVAAGLWFARRRSGR
jgi:hypothetical protein